MHVLASILTLAMLTPMAGSHQNCLDMATATGTTFTSDHAMVVRTRDHDAYRVTFRHSCAVGVFPRTYFVYEPWTVRPCLHSGHVLGTNGRGPCVVDTVTKLATQ